MPVAFLTHPACLEHRTGGGHPERPERLRAVLEAVRRDEALDEQLRRLEPEPVDDDLLRSVHAPRYVEHVRRVSAEGGGMLDPDTVVSAASFEAARRAAGAATAAVDVVLSGEAPAAFAAIRPPGHHARPAAGMGFCLFNNAACAALWARQRHGRSRVMILDWDVHHGNGTQEIFYASSAVLFVSLHQEHWYPGTGAMEETGTGEGTGFTINIPLPAGAGDGAYAHVFEEVVLPVTQAFAPQLLLISAGYDAHADDPLGGMRLTAGGFRRLTQLVRAVYAGPLAAVLEGGYDLGDLGRSVVATLRALAGLGPGEPEPPGEDAVPYAAIRARTRAVRGVVRTTWPI